MQDSPATLQAAFSFAPDDLAANQAGHISAAQQTMLHKRIRRANRIAIGFAIALAIIPVGGLAVYAPQANWPIIGLNVFLLVLLPLMGYAIASGERTQWQRDAQHNVAACVYGIATLTPPAGRQGPKLAIDGTGFTISPEQSATIVAGDTYAVYYAPRSQRILSIQHEV